MWDFFLINTIPKGMYLKHVDSNKMLRWFKTREDTSLCENTLQVEKLAASSARKTLSTIARKWHFSLIVSVVCLQM